MTILKRTLIVVAFAATVSTGASAFNPSGLVNNVAQNAMAGKRQVMPVASK
jgi:hypothetical protein